jgi:signal transduction histidine kinase
VQHRALGGPATIAGERPSGRAGRTFVETAREHARALCKFRAAITARAIATFRSAASDARTPATPSARDKKFLRVFHNLARNAAEAMPEGGKLVVGVEKVDDQLVWSVKDDGPGIPPELSGRLFELFATGKKGGTGLGLAIVKKIIDDHHGSIAVESGSSGTNFIMKVPMQRATDGD